MYCFEGKTKTYTFVWKFDRIRNIIFWRRRRSEDTYKAFVRAFSTTGWEYSILKEQTKILIMS